MIKHFTQKKFSEEHITTLGLDFASENYTAKDGKEVTVKVWDTAGQERFRTLTHAFYRNADGIVIAYDVTDQKTFNNIKTWVESIE